MLHGLTRMLLVAALIWLPATYAADLHIEVTGANSAEGRMAIALFVAPGVGFPFDDRLAVRRVRVPIDGASGLCTTTIQDLPEGDYAVALYHDVDDSGTLETGFLGKPKKPYGYSNNPRPVARAARFAEARFELTGDGASIAIELQ